MAFMPTLQYRDTQHPRPYEISTSNCHIAHRDMDHSAQRVAGVSIFTVLSRKRSTNRSSNRQVQQHHGIRFDAKTRNAPVQQRSSSFRATSNYDETRVHSRLVSTKSPYRRPYFTCLLWNVVHLSRSSTIFNHVKGSRHCTTSSLAIQHPSRRPYHRIPISFILIFMPSSFYVLLRTIALISVTHRIL